MDHACYLEFVLAMHNGQVPVATFLYVLHHVYQVKEFALVQDFANVFMVIRAILVRYQYLPQIALMVMLLLVLINVYVILDGEGGYVIIQYAKGFRGLGYHHHQIVEKGFVFDLGNVNVSLVGN
jgi:hypothetical protein